MLVVKDLPTSKKNIIDFLIEAKRSFAPLAIQHKHKKKTKIEKKNIVEKKLGQINFHMSR